MIYDIYVIISEIDLLKDVKTTSVIYFFYQNAVKS